MVSGFSAGGGGATIFIIYPVAGAPGSLGIWMNRGFDPPLDRGGFKRATT